MKKGSLKTLARNLRKKVREKTYFGQPRVGVREGTKRPKN